MLVFNSGLIFRGSYRRRTITKAKRRQAADVLARCERNPGEGNRELLRNILVVKQIVAVGAEVVETETKFVDQVIAKTMDLARSQPLGGVVAVAILKTPTIEHVIKGRWEEVAVIAVAEAGKEIIFVADGLVDANVKLIFRLAALGIREVVATGQRGIRRGEEISQLLAQGIDTRRGRRTRQRRADGPRENVGRHSAGCGTDGNAARSAVKRRIGLCLVWIENLTRIGRIAAAIQETCRGGRIEKRGEIPANLGRRGNGGQLRQRLANPKAFVVSEKE